ncbi:MAG: porphobilinogen synthase [Verrucomicrobia bacterium]|nr:porphobilinogen synthase [Verrucomicrobiota bacterium]MBS0646690.1 porphobilinogen synthase [Verrucomicrobiota bacterium]
MLLKRPRRNRKSAAIRSLVCETRLAASQLIYPLFIKEGSTEPVSSFPRIHRFCETDLLKEIERSLNLGIHSFALFPIIDTYLKNEQATEAVKEDNLLHKTLRAIKSHFPETCVNTDVALDPYTSHGHDGIYDPQQKDIANDPTVSILAEMALRQAEAGSDMVAPSDMMDGRVIAIRKVLDDHGFSHVNIHSYAIKYASCLYGPFRDAVGSQLKFGNKKTYQLNPANFREALLEAALDEEEGADIVMVKPASLYLDIICRLREHTHLPISAFQVSGEYAAILSAAQQGWLDEKQGLWESLLGIRRAGADMIFTYAAPQVAQWLKEGIFD